MSISTWAAIQSRSTSPAARSGSMAWTARIRVTQVILTAAGDVIDQQALAATTQPYAANAFAYPLVALGGNFSDAAVDADNDGQNDYLGIAVPIQPGSSGVVIVQGRLVDKNGGDIQWAETDAAVTAGVMQTVTLPFSATEILAHGVDGPYELRNVLIYNTGDPSQAVTDLPAYVTAGYRHTDLSIFIGGAATLAMSAAPEQLIADGTSTSKITVVVEDAGGNLVPNQPVQFTTTAGQLTASSGSTGIDGKVSVDLVAPTTAGQATVTAIVGSINQAAVVSFAAGQPAVITTVITPTVLAADGQSVATVRARVTDAFGNPIAGASCSLQHLAGFHQRFSPDGRCGRGRCAADCTCSRRDRPGYGQHRCRCNRRRTSRSPKRGATCICRQFGAESGSSLTLGVGHKVRR